MNGHKVFKTPFRLVILMVIGLNYILKDWPLACLVGIGVYAAAVWIEQIREEK